MPKRRPEIVELDLDQELFESRREATSMQLPLAVHHRLDVLAERAKKTAASRAEIIGMLIAEADFSASAIEARISHYRNLSVRDVIPGMSDLPQDEALAEGAEAVPGRGNVFAFERRGPGRPGRKAG
jgi:predicted DNA-binding protein